MTTKYILQTFEDIVDACLEELGADSNDLKTVNRIKRDINSVYLQEIVPESNWYWLTRSTEVQAKAYTSTGTAAFTSGSTTVTTSETFSQCYRGYYISSEGYNEVYRIAQHTAGSQTLTLETPFGGTTVAAATFKIWTDTLALPADCMKTSEVRHSFRNVPLEGVGRKEFRKMSSTAPRAEARPECYCTGNIVDPIPFDAISGLPASTFRSSSGLVRTVVFASTLGSTGSTKIMPGDRIEVSSAGNYRYDGAWLASSVSTTTATNDTVTFTAEENYTESSAADTSIVVKKAPGADSYSRYREMMIWPALFSANTTLYVDYLVEPQPLVEDDDEPLIPLEDRNVLLYGALSRSWVKVRDEDTANRNASLYEKKLAKMSGRIEDSLDLPQIRISPQYLRGKRRSGKSYGTTIPDTLGFAIGGGASSITGTPNRAAIFDSDGRLVSDSVVSKTELEYLDGVTSPIQTQIDALSTLADGKIYVGNSSNVATEVTPTGDVTISDTGVTAISSGVIVNSDVNTSAAIAYSKLNLTGNVVDADVSSSAAIARSKTAAGTAYRVLANNSSGVMSENAAITGSKAVASDANGQLVASSTSATELGYVAGVTSAIQTQLGTKIDTVAAGTTPNTNGASISGTTLTLQTADATHPGIVGTAAQTWAGAKTFSTAPVLSSLSASLPLKTDGSKNITAAAIDLSGTEATGTLAAARMPALTGDVTTSAGSVATTITPGTITNAMVNASAGIVDTKLATISTAGKVSNSATTAVSAATASTIVLRDSNANTNVNNLVEGQTSTATAAGTTTLTVASTYQQIFTGSTTQTVVLPVASTLSLGFPFCITNLSSGIVTVQSSGGNTLQAMAANTRMELNCILASGTGTASWNWQYSPVQNTLGGTGSVTSVTFTGDGTVLSSTPSSAVTTSGTVTAALKTQTANNIFCGPSSGSAANPTFRALVPLDGVGLMPFAASKIADYTATTADYAIPYDLTTAGASKTLTLPTAAGAAGIRYFIYIVATSSSRTLTIATTSSQTVGGIASGKIKLGTVDDRLILISDGSNWQIEVCDINVNVHCTVDGTGQALTSSGTSTHIKFDTKIEDPTGRVTTGASWVYTAMLPGMYLISGQVFSANTSSGQWQLTSAKNSTTAGRRFESCPTSAGGSSINTNQATCTFSYLIRLAVDDTANLYLSGAATTANVYTGTDDSFINIVRVSF